MQETGPKCWGSPYPDTNNRALLHNGGSVSGEELVQCDVGQACVTVVYYQSGKHDGQSNDHIAMRGCLDIVNDSTGVKDRCRTDHIDELEFDDQVTDDSNGSGGSRCCLCTGDGPSISRSFSLYAL